MSHSFHGAAISAQQLAALLDDGEEIALLDTREEGVYARNHLLLAASLPVSRLELDLHRRVPRRATRIVVINDDQDAADVSGARLASLGYTQVAHLAGGNGAWLAAGYRLFSGLYVPSKAFGEVVEHTALTPRLTADEVHRLQATGAPLLIVDSRPFEEFREFSVPGGLNCPGAELAARVAAQTKFLPPETTVVVNCAGRTRSIIGAQSLINAGLPYKVVALENGTMGWHLSGHPLAHGADQVLEDAAPDESLHIAARALSARTGVQVVDWQQAEAFRRETARTTYFYDVRLASAYLAGHLPGFDHAPGGQLVQSTDFYAPVRGARIVVADTHGVQAHMTAHWLAQMGWNTYVLEPGADVPLVEGREPVAVQVPADAQGISVDDLDAALVAGAVVVVDCGDSRAYRRRRLIGSSFATRSSLPRSLHSLPDLQRVFVSEDGSLARLAAADVLQAGGQAVFLDGGLNAWVAVGKPTEPGTDRFLSATDDAWYSPYQVPPEEMADAMRSYISWETDLLQAIDAEPGLRFRTL